MGCMRENPNPKTYSYAAMLNLVPEAYWGLIGSKGICKLGVMQGSYSCVPY